MYVFSTFAFRVQGKSRQQTVTKQSTTVHTGEECIEVIRIVGLREQEIGGGLRP